MRNQKTAETVASCEECLLGRLCLAHESDEVVRLQLKSIIAQPISLHAGEHIYRTGDKLKSLFIVKAGFIKVYVPTHHGEEQILGFHLPGELLGLDALGSSEHRCEAIALAHSHVCVLPMAKMSDLCRLSSKIRRQLNRLMGRQLTNIQQMLLLLGKKSAEGRVAAFLLNMSDRFEERGFPADEFHLGMSRHDIANYLGLAVETVSRILSRFQDEKLLAVRSRYVRIYDIDELRRLVSDLPTPPHGTLHNNGAVDHTSVPRI